MRKKRPISITTIILVILVIGLSSFILYDKVLKNEEYIATGIYYYIDYEYDKPNKQYNFSLKLTNSDDNYRIKELIFTK